MTRYEVVFSDMADAEATTIYLNLSTRIGTEAALGWYETLLLEAQEQLSLMPRRFPISEDGSAAYPGSVVRRWLYGRGRTKYQVLFLVIEPQAEEAEGIVQILRVRHAAARPLGQPEVEEQ